MVRLLLVRHARAGARGSGPSDLDRPLDDQGRAQAEALVGLLAPELALPGDPQPEVRSSPARRCIETVTPLANALATHVITDRALVEGSDLLALHDRIAQVTMPTVWCSHGDVIPELLAMLQRRGLDLGDDPSCRKGSTWVLEVTAGEVAAAHHLAPPG
jgi:phosphohistidine phosphatase SixA